MDINKNIEIFNNKIVSAVIKYENGKITLSDSADEVLDAFRVLGLSLSNSLVNERGRIAKALFDSCPQLFESPLMSRAYLKPLGYAGDFDMLEAIYESKLDKSSSASVVFDSTFLRSDLGRAVVGRKNYFRDLLLRTLSLSNLPVKVLNIASGSAREVRELQTKLDDLNLLDITFVDFEIMALDFCKDQLSCPKGKLANSSYINANIRDFENSPVVKEKYDLIYSLGLYDYLTDDFLISHFSLLKNMLLTEGKIVISFKDCRKYAQTDYLLLDWFFYARTEEDCLKIIKSSGLTLERMEREENGIILNFHCS